MASTSKIIIKSDAINNNVNFVKSLVGSSVTVSAVIKGNAYGHGTLVMVQAFEKEGINHFSVYSSSEARDAFKAKSKNSTIMIMGVICENDFLWIIKNNIEFYVSSLDVLNKAVEYSKKAGSKARIHIDVETGMNRTGIAYKDLKKLVSTINSNLDYLEIIGITSHFAGAESIANHTRIKKQYSVFKKRVKYFENNKIAFKIKHLASSAATINYPDTRLDLVRVGILLYGYWPTKETFINYIHRRKDKSDPIKRAIRWYSKAISIKTIPEGEFIGYGMSFQTQYKMRIMIVPVGYSNGYSRSLSNNGHVIVNGQKTAIVGIVNMNMIICDITNVDNVKIGDEVVLIGKQDENEISFSSFAEMNNSLNYEILARLPENIERELDEQVTD
ncbi:MAG: alanine racemase [Bacteroidota bacterium]|nr:alanine racemase [Bacteroidota bacterium]